MPSRTMTALLAALAGVAAVAAAAPAAAAGTPQASARACQAGQLSIAQNYEGRQNGRLERGVDLVVTNHDPNVSCTVDGYLDVQVLDGAGDVEAATVAHGDTVFERDPGPAPITPAPGGRAAGDLAWSHTSAPSDPHITPAYLRITVPGTAQPFTIPFDPGPVYRGDLTTTALSAFTGPRP